MTAGKGIVHAEMPAGDGDNNGLQLWINLRKEHKVNRSLISFQYANILINV